MVACSILVSALGLIVGFNHLLGLAWGWALGGVLGTKGHRFDKNPPQVVSEGHPITLDAYFAKYTTSSRSSGI